MAKNSTHIHCRNFILHLQECVGYDGSVLIKEPAHESLTSSLLGQLRNEYIISTQLSNVCGVRPAYAMEGTESQPMLLLEYIPGQDLAELISSTSLVMAEKLRLAVNVAKVLSCIHEQQVMHKDLTSSNILVADIDKPDSQDGVYIIDFGIASTLRQESVSRLAPNDTLWGTLAYISPEQTGRMNRHVDYRTDLYSLGVVLYELFTGQLPFESVDALEMIHAQIARQPQAPHEIEADIPDLVSEVILKLLSKNAEDRYQTTGGLQVDLQRCLDQWQSQGRIEPFSLGGDDISDRLIIPEKLYGRQSEIEQLRAILDRALSGQPQLMLVAGYPGVGKTSLVHEIKKDVISKQAIFVEGKFDQFQRTQPYSGWSQAFTRLVENMLMQSQSSLDGWRDAILEAVGDLGQILIDVIPDLVRIIGPQPEVPQLGGIESQTRFNYIFNRFISILATPDHSLVIFLDDLQWIDSASLNLIEALLAAQTTSSFLLIGAYRDNEVGADHPLVASQNRIRETTNQITGITLPDLGTDDVSHLLADTLQLTAPECRDLSQVVVDKTAGNPFYFRQLLFVLESDKELNFDKQQRRWVWEDNLQQSLQARGSVVDLMIGKIQTLSVESQQILSAAACIGSRFEVSTLSTVTGQPPTDILTELNLALNAGLIIQSNGHYMFSHDRIQEAGYALISESDLPKMHLEIGRRLLAATQEERMEEEIFDIVGHLNTGRALIDEGSEMTELAVLNLKAGQKAKTTSAYSDAKKYIEVGLDLLRPDSWQEQYELTLSLHNENGKLAYLTGHYDQIFPTAELIHRNARNVPDQVRIYMTQIEAETGQYNFAKALEIGLDVLRDLGFEIPAHPTGEDNRRLKDRFTNLFAEKATERIAQLPEMSDESALAASSILASEVSTAYFSDRSFFPILCYNGAILTLKFGLNVWSPFFLGGIALTNLASIDQETPADEARYLIQLNKQLIEIIREMLDNPVTARSRTKCLTTIAFVVPWIEPIEQGFNLCRSSYLSGYETGDLLYGSYSANAFAFTSLAAGMNLSAYQNLISDYIDSLHQMGQKVSFQYMSLYLQTAQNFINMSSAPHRLVGASFNEDKWLPKAITANDVTGRHYLYVNKLILAYHFDVDDKLDEYAVETEKFTSGTLSVYSVPLFHLYCALGKLRLVGGSSSEEHPGVMNMVNKSLDWMAIWAEATPSTFQHKFDLIAAEKARVTADLDGALSHYEQAISGARENGFIHEEALANELYARFWLERGNERLSSLFMREAHSLYRKWGAIAKAEHLTKRYPNLLIGRSIAVDTSGKGATYDQRYGALDLMTVLKTSQAIAGELTLDGLLAKLMTNVIENSGAQQGYLILEQDGQWIIRAQADADGLEPQVEKSIPIAESDLLSQGIVRYVARTQRTVLLDNASQYGEFIDDPYVRRRQTKSIICVPLINQGKTSAILYLENNLSLDVFTTERVELLQLLSSQMAISIDNARTHDQLEKLLEERSKALSSAEGQINSIFEHSPLGIALSTYTGEILTLNQALLDMLRISEEELLRKGATDLYVEPADRITLLAEVRQSGSVRDFGVQLVRNDGEYFYASVNMSRLVLEGNEVLLTLVEDVTEELAAEQETAAITEREHLARELHDSVSQILFTAGMIADATPRLWDKDPASGQQNLEMLSVMIRGASAEMRSLLLELRPDTLKDQTLGKLLETLTVAASARTRAAVFLKVERDCLLPDDVTLSIHRIAQESLNNIAKHAEASEVLIDLSCSPESANLYIEDDGRGFDPQAIPAGHLGIDIMRERAKKIGATFQINSEPGNGTSVLVTWSGARGED